MISSILQRNWPRFGNSSIAIVGARVGKSQVTHQLLLRAIRRKDDNRPVHPRCYLSIIYVVLFCDDYHLVFHVAGLWFWQRVVAADMAEHDTLQRSTVANKSYRFSPRMLTCPYALVRFYPPGTICKASSSSNCFQMVGWIRLSRSAVSVQLWHP